MVSTRSLNNFGSGRYKESKFCLFCGITALKCDPVTSQVILENPFIFMHLTDAFIQSNLHCIQSFSVHGVIEN